MTDQEQEIQEAPFDERSWFQVNLEAVIYPAIEGREGTEEEEAVEGREATASWEITACQFLAMAGSDDGLGMTQEVTKKGDRRFTVFVLTLDAEEAMRTAVSLAGVPMDDAEV